MYTDQSDQIGSDRIGSEVLAWLVRPFFFIFLKKTRKEKEEESEGRKEGNKMGKVPPATYYDSGMKEGRKGGFRVCFITTLSRADNGSAYLKKKRI